MTIETLDNIDDEITKKIEQNEREEKVRSEAYYSGFLAGTARFYSAMHDEIFKDKNNKTNGCDFCNNEVTIRLGDNNNVIIARFDDFVRSDIDYCPCCGRKLTEETGE